MKKQKPKFPVHSRNMRVKELNRNISRILRKGINLKYITKNLNRLLNHKGNLAGLLFILFIFSGCSRDKKETEYVARVNDSYLTEKELTAVSEGSGGQKFFKEEFIRNWINRELLYQQAVKEGLLNEAKYLDLMKNSGKELAAVMMIEKMLSENLPVYKPEDVSKYFEQNPEMFKMKEKAYLINIAEFSDEDRAVMFRSAAVESDWNKALNFFNNDPALKKQEMNKLLYQYDLQPLKLSRIINELYPGEISLIIPGEDRNFLVVKLISVLEEGTIPPFEIIKDDAEKRFIAAKKADILKSYYEDLYSSNEIDIKNREF